MLEFTNQCFYLGNKEGLYQGHLQAETAEASSRFSFNDACVLVSVLNGEIADENPGAQWEPVYFDPPAVVAGNLFGGDAAVCNTVDGLLQFNAEGLVRFWDCSHNDDLEVTLSTVTPDGTECTEIYLKGVFQQERTAKMDG